MRNLILALLLAASATAQPADSTATRASLEAVLAHRLVLDAERDRAGATLDSLQALDDSLAIAAAELEMGLRAGGPVRFEARSSMAHRLLRAPTYGGTVVTVVPRGATVTIVDKDGAFYLVEHGDYRGYVMPGLLEGEGARAAADHFSGRPPRVVTTRLAAAPSGATLHVGPRGGCYYVNGSGNRQYVDRSECSGLSTVPATTRVSAPRSTSGGRVSVRGYYRSDGTYVRPHTRSRPRRRN